MPSISATVAWGLGTSGNAVSSAAGPPVSLHLGLCQLWPPPFRPWQPQVWTPVGKAVPAAKSRSTSRGAPPGGAVLAGPWVHAQAWGQMSLEMGCPH